MESPSCMVMCVCKRTPKIIKATSQNSLGQKFIRVGMLLIIRPQQTKVGERDFFPDYEGHPQCKRCVWLTWKKQASPQLQNGPCKLEM